MTTPGTATAATIAPLDAARLDALEPLWRTLIDHLRELGSVVELVPHERSWPRRRAIYEELLADGASFALGAWRGDRLIGYAMVRVAAPDAVWSTGSHYAELLSLSVAPGERGSGVGGDLLDAVEAGLTSRGIDQYVIGVDTVNAGAQRFYERRGFRDGFHLLHGWVGGAAGAAAAGRDSRATGAAAPGSGGDAKGIVETPETAMHGEE